VFYVDWLIFWPIFGYLFYYYDYQTYHDSESDGCRDGRLGSALDPKGLEQDGGHPAGPPPLPNDRSTLADRAEALF